MKNRGFIFNTYDNRQNDLPWINYNIWKLIRKRNRLRRRAPPPPKKKQNNEYLWSKFRKIRNSVVEHLRSTKKTYYENLCDKLNSNKFGSKDWWKLVKKLSGRSPSKNISTLVTDSGDDIQDDIEKANLINKFFTLQCTIDDTGKPLPQTQNNNMPCLENIEIGYRCK